MEQKSQDVSLEQTGTNNNTNTNTNTNTNNNNHNKSTNYNNNNNNNDNKDGACRSCSKIEYRRKHTSSRVNYKPTKMR